MKTYRELLADPPRETRWSDVVNFDRWDVRMACVDELFADIIGVNEGYVEWCPNDEPPSMDETLAWIWVIRPDLGNEIIVDASRDLRVLIEMYQGNDLEYWWNYITD